MKVFIAHSHKDRMLASAVSHALRERGDEVVDPFEIDATGSIVSAISAEIRTADAVLAIVSEPNANIYYELGMASALDVPLLIAAAETELVPADLASTRFVRIGADEAVDAREIVHRLATIKPRLHVAELQGSATERLRAATEDPERLESMKPDQFARLVVDVLAEKGFAVHEAGPRSDLGADFIIGGGGYDQVLVETKKLSRHSRVSMEAVTQLATALERTGAKTGLLISSSGFSEAAWQFAFGAHITLLTPDDLLAAQSPGDLLPVVRTILFADLVSYSGFRDLREDALRARDAMLRAARRLEHAGLTLSGDAATLVLPDVDTAIRCAREILSAVRSAGGEVRIGIATGTLLQTHGDSVGAAFMIAARLAANASGRSILVIDPDLEKNPRRGFVEIPQDLAAVRRPASGHRIYELVEGETANRDVSPHAS